MAFEIIDQVANTCTIKGAPLPVIKEMQTQKNQVPFCNF